jgi:hypothetical protein
MITEQIHRYPRWIKWPIELISALVVLFTSALLARDILRYLWFLNGGADTTFFNKIPYLPELYLYIYGVVGTDRSLITNLSDFILPLIWLALGLLLALLLRNAFPTIRTSARGMLVEFGNDWLPVPWETLKAIKVTEDASAERFVLLVEVAKPYLVGWHRLYSFLYRFGFQRGFLVVSAISDFDGLIRTLLSESDRVASVLENVKPARLQEDASSPLFRLVMGPASFFSRPVSSQTTPVPDQSVVAGGSLIRGIYPSRLQQLQTWLPLVIVIILLIRYLLYWGKFLVIVFPTLYPLPVFNRMVYYDLNVQAPWWLLVAAHLMLIIVIGILFVLRNLLPELEARPQGIAVRYFNRWHVVPWTAITAIKVTEITEKNQVLLLQCKQGLPFASRFSSFIYDGSFSPGVLITSAMDTFAPMLQRIVLEINRHNPIDPEADEDTPPILQDQSRSWFLYFTFQATGALDTKIAEVQEDDDTKLLQMPRVLAALKPMLCLALPFPIMLFFTRAIQMGILPNGALILSMLFLAVLVILEWPIVSMIAMTLDESFGRSSEGYRSLYLYPYSQLPRMLPLTVALLFILLGIPVLPTLLLLGAIIWSFLLAAGLWEGLYQWHGSKLMISGAIPVVYQLLILLVFMVLSR